VIAVQSLAVLLFVLLAVFMASSLCADTDDVSGELNACFSPPSQDSRFPMDLSWIVEWYDFDWIEEYVDEYYGAYHRYLTSKQREFARKLGLSNIYFKPNFRCYGDTKVVISKGVWNNRLLFRYLAPVGSMGDLKLSIALRPHRSVAFVAEGHTNGEKRVVIAVDKLLGRGNRSREMTRRARRILAKVRRLMN
jgi:hypothetical protein